MLSWRDHPLGEAARHWFEALQECVRAVDYRRARDLFADEVVSFGTHASLVFGRDALQREQWSHVWPAIREFTFRLDEILCHGDERGLCAVALWDSLGTGPGGSTYPRPGRATVLLELRQGRMVATHTHFSLSPSPA